MMSESNTSSESGSEQTEDGTKADDKQNDTIVASGTFKYRHTNF